MIYPSSSILVANLEKIGSCSEILWCQKNYHRKIGRFYEKLNIGTWILLMGTLACFYFWHLSWSMSTITFFDGFLNFFPDLYLAAQFLACLSKEVHPDNTLMLFRKLTYGCSLITHFKAPVSCKRSIFLRIYQ